MNGKPLLLWGATGQSLVLHEFLCEREYRLLALVDNDPKVLSPFPGTAVLQGFEALDPWLEHQDGDTINYVVAIGGSRGRDRCLLSEQLRDRGLSPVQALHPRAHVARDARLGRGAQVMMGGMVCSRAELGDWVIVNTGASVDHECHLGAGVHLGPASVLCGRVTVGDNSFLGAGSVVLPRITIGANSIIGAGSVVTRDLPDQVVAYGNPARVIRKISALPENCS